jgi:phospholipid/cholesterol/gamma-HCH transport system substrate-binding protein
MESLMGAVVLVVAVGFLAFAYNTSKYKTVDGYVVSADFSDASGIAIGSDVRIGGIKVGVVSDLNLNTETYEATTHMTLKDGVGIPSDSSASIVSDGLLGSKYVAIEPGADSFMLEDGEAIEYTQSSVSLEKLIGKFVFSGGGVDSETPTNETSLTP